MIRLCAFADEASEDLRGQIMALRKNEISLLEIRTVSGKNVKDFSLEEAKEYAKFLKENGIEVFSIGSPLGKVDISINIDEYLLTVRHICKIANIFETDKVRVFSFFNAYSQGEKVMEYLSKMVEVAKEYGVELYHENEKDVYGDIDVRVSEILEKVKGIKSIYDPANYLYCSQSADQTAYLEKKADYFHMKDAIFGKCQIVPVGHGDGKVDELIKGIKGDKVLSVEPHLAIFSGYSQIDKSELKNKFSYASNEEAFDAAVSAVKDLLIKAGYREEKGIFIK